MFDCALLCEMSFYLQKRIYSYNIMLVVLSTKPIESCTCIIVHCLTCSLHSCQLHML